MIYQTYLTLYAKLNHRVRKFISATLLIGAICIISLLGYTTIEFTQAINEADSAQLIMIEAEATKYVLIDAETGQRGYVITGDDRFLDPYNLAQLRFATQMNTLKAVMGEKAFNDSNILLLANSKMAELAKTVDMRRTQGFEPTREYIQNYLGKQIMDSLRTIIQSVESRETETVMIATRHARHLSEAMVFEAILILICFTTLILFPWGIEPPTIRPIVIP